MIHIVDPGYCSAALLEGNGGESRRGVACQLGKGKSLERGGDSWEEKEKEEEGEGGRVWQVVVMVEVLVAETPQHQPPLSPFA